jgi:cysteine desulfurase/selenocysteine lyase
MITSDRGVAGVDLTSVAAPSADAGFAAELARLANQLFAHLPGAAPTRGGVPAPVAPPHLGPGATDVGGGGISAGSLPPAGPPSLPPLPGVLHAPPIASAPPPKESDLRTLPALFSEPLGFSAPIALVGGAAPNGAEPGLATGPASSAPSLYFLDHAGLAAAAPPSAAIPVATEPATSPMNLASPGVSPPSAAIPRAGVDAGAPAGRPPLTGGAHFDPEVVPDLAPARGIFDAASIRRDFPILAERVHGRPLIWLDNAATTQKPRAVIERLSYFYEHENSNIHRAAHALAARATDAYEAARDKVRRFLNAPSPREIVFVRGATEAINLVAQAWGRRNLQSGDEVVVTWLEHHANIVPWQQICAERGARLCVAPVDSSGQVILEEYEKLLNPRTRLVALTQVSNALGTITPARDMVAMAHRQGAVVLVDGAQAVSHMPVDVQALDCDFYCFSGHKVFAPTGIGVLYGKPDVLQAMPPWQGGGNMIADVTFEKTVYQPPPWRFEAGTGNIADAVGLGAAIDYVSAIGLDSIARYEHELLVHATEGLRRVPGLTIIGTAPDKAGVLSFVIDGLRSEDIGAELDREGIAVRSGHHCAQPILRRFGLQSTVRASLAPYNTYEDVDALCAALLRLTAGRPR